jgi:uncharacterized RDD family membrane protein YckC
MQGALDEPIIQRENVRVIYGGFWPRLGALFIDAIILAPISFGLTYYNIVSMKSGAVMMLVAVASIAYKPIMEFYYGATLGKMALNLKVTNLDFERADLQTILLRNIFHIAPPLITALLSFGIYSHPDFEAVSGYIEYSAFSRQFVGPQIVNSIAGLIVIVEAIMIAIDDQKRSLHDRIAGTYVIEK